MTGPDDVSRWPWEPLHPADTVELLAGFDRPWWICGGWALDLFLDRETRRHDDLDVAVLRGDQAALHDFLRGWDLRYATPAHTLEPWHGERLELPVHGIWARRSREPEAPWTCEFLLNEHDSERWVFRRAAAITRPLAEIGDSRDGVPFLRPGLVLLYKAKDTSPKDEADFGAVLADLDADERVWLAEALMAWDPDHAWRARVLAQP